MKFFRRITHGTIFILIGLLHTQFVFSSGGFGNQFAQFCKRYFYQISKGLDELPAIAGHTNFETFSAFWFFYFGILFIPLGLLLHGIEHNKISIPRSFTITYLLFVLVGCYMIPNSGITVFMLPHALFMFIQMFVKSQNVKNHADV